MHEPIVRTIVAVLWLAWLLYWWASARDVKATRWREPLTSQLLHRVPLVLAVILQSRSVVMDGTSARLVRRTSRVEPVSSAPRARS